jgi:hypothetical protein
MSSFSFCMEETFWTPALVSYWGCTSKCIMGCLFGVPLPYWEDWRELYYCKNLG